MTRKLIKTNQANETTLTQQLAESVSLWGEVTTSNDNENRELLFRNKTNDVLDFFNFAQLAPQHVNATIVRAWKTDLETVYAESTVYLKLSRLKGFYNWLIDDCDIETLNPVNPLKIKPPKPYEQSKALRPDQLRAIKSQIESKADSGKVTAVRDLAIFNILVISGQRRNEILSLTYGDISIDGDSIFYTTKVKGGKIRDFQITSPMLVNSIKAYLVAIAHPMTDDAPLWLGTRAYGSGQTTDKPKGMTSRNFATSLKRYSKAVGIEGVHVHQLRHAYAQMVADSTGDIVAVQQALGHKSVNTTRHYVEKLGTKVNKHASVIESIIGY